MNQRDQHRYGQQRPEEGSRNQRQGRYGAMPPSGAGQRQPSRSRFTDTYNPEPQWLHDEEASARRFAELVGVSPKTFARVVRLGRVVERARAVPPNEPVNWSALAIELGYYDQSHLVDEFREMTGITPAAWHSRESGR